MTAPEPTLRHLPRMTDDTSLFEHAIGALPNRALRYCSDDAGRALAVLAGPIRPTPSRWRNACSSSWSRRTKAKGGFACEWASIADGRTTRAPTTPVVERSSAWGWRRLRPCGRTCATRRAGCSKAAAVFRFPFPRATAHAVVGAAELLLVDPACASARPSSRRARRCRWFERRSMAVARSTSGVRERAVTRGRSSPPGRGGRRRRG